jgi:anaerobic selenocysteine-containing dehydrogenase
MPKEPSKTNEPLSRREALRRFGVVGGGAVAVAGAATACRQPPWEQGAPDPTGRALNKPPVPGADRYATGEERWVNTSCAQCPAGCGVRVRVVEGRAVRIEGNPHNPLNQGGIGPRGLSALQGLYDADRIPGPLLRTGGRLEPVSWETALTRVTERLADLRARRAAHKLLVLCGRERGFMRDLLARFSLAFGTPNFVDGHPGHSAVLAQAMKATLGVMEIPAFDWTGADYVVSFGAGLLEDSCQSIYFARAAGELRRRGSGHRAKLVHIGPVFDLSAHNADEWIRIRPGTNGALALTVCHVLVSENRYDARSVRSSTAGFDEFAGFLRRFTPAWCAGITGVPEGTVVRIAREIAAARFAFAFVDERSLSFYHSYGTALAVLALNALLGAIERPQGGVRIAPQAPVADWPAVMPDAVAQAGLATPRLDGAGTSAYPLARSVHETLPDRLEDDAMRPEVALLYYTNPAYARQQPERWVRALRRIPFIVSFSPYRDETVERLADVVLPDHTPFERWEDAGAAPGIARATVGIRAPTIEPLLGTRASGDVLLSLARGLGESMQRAFPWHSFRDALVDRLRGLYHAPKGNIAAASESAFVNRLFEEGFWAEREDPPRRPVQFRFHTEFHEPEWHGDPEKFPLRLIAYRPQGYAEGSGANHPWLRYLRGRPNMRAWGMPVSVRPESAPHGAHEGDAVRVTSPWGSIVGELRFDPNLEPGFVLIPAGAGHTAFGRWAAGFGANVMDLLRPGPAPSTGANVLSCTRVHIAREATAHRRT